MAEKKKKVDLIKVTDNASKEARLTVTNRLNLRLDDLRVAHARFKTAAKAHSEMVEEAARYEKLELEKLEKEFAERREEVLRTAARMVSRTSSELGTASKTRCEAIEAFQKAHRKLSSILDELDVEELLDIENETSLEAAE
jgi:hypothetical protein